MLYRRGAEVVGVASSQAGNCFIDSLGYTLANTGLKGSISYKRNVLFPDDVHLGKVLTPRVSLRYGDLLSHKFDPHTSVHLALRFLAEGKAGAHVDGPMTWRWRGAADGALGLLRHRYNLSSLVSGKKAGLPRLTVLRDWVHRRWQHHSTNRPQRMDALSILANAERGERFRCVEYSIVLAQVYRAMGYCARLIRLQGKGAHVATEVYAPTLGKNARTAKEARLPARHPLCDHKRPKGILSYLLNRKVGFTLRPADPKGGSQDFPLLLLYSRSCHRDEGLSALDRVGNLQRLVCEVVNAG